MSDLANNLRQFIGSTEYYQHQLGIVYTEGVHYLAEQAGAFWLLDAIASWQPEIAKLNNPDVQDFQIWVLKKAVVAEPNAAQEKPHAAILTMHDDLPGEALGGERFVSFSRQDTGYVTHEVIVFASGRRQHRQWGGGEWGPVDQLHESDFTRELLRVVDHCEGDARWVAALDPNDIAYRGAFDALSDKVRLWRSAGDALALARMRQQPEQPETD